MKKCLFALGVMMFLFVTFLSSVNATNWELIDELPDSKIYIDSSSVAVTGVRKKEGDKRKVRTLVSYKTEQRNVDGVKFLSMSFVDVFSCANRLRTTLSSVQYEGKAGTGRVVNSHKMGFLMPVNIMAGSVDELILGEANCNLFSGKW